MTKPYMVRCSAIKPFNFFGGGLKKALVVFLKHFLWFDVPLRFKLLFGAVVFVVSSSNVI